MTIDAESADGTTDPPPGAGSVPGPVPPAAPPPGPKLPKEVGGPPGPEPTRYGDWQYKGRVTDF